MILSRYDSVISAFALGAPAPSGSVNFFFASFRMFRGPKPFLIREFHIIRGRTHSRSDHRPAPSSHRSPLAYAPQSRPTFHTFPTCILISGYVRVIPMRHIASHNRGSQGQFISEIFGPASLPSTTAPSFPAPPPPSPPPLPPPASTPPHASRITHHASRITHQTPSNQIKPATPRRPLVLYRQSTFLARKYRLIPMESASPCVRP